MFDVRNRMKDAFPQLPPKNPNDPAPKQIRVDVVDNYQGEECDIIILSIVRSNHPENKIGFLNASLLSTNNQIRMKCKTFLKIKPKIF